MKNLISLKQACLGLLFFVSSATMAQFVTLDGRQFKDGNGQDWYPMVMDYALSIFYPLPPDTCDNLVFIPQLNSLYLAQNQPNGVDLSPECENPTECLQQVINDFISINNMGFDAIRITNGPYWFPSDQKFKIQSNCGIEGYWGSCRSCSIELNQPYVTDDVTNRFFELLDQVIDIAEELNLKIMLDIMLFNGSMESYFDPSMIEPYKEYLNVMGNHYKNDTNIFSYVIFEEIQLNDRITDRNKHDICNYTTELYDKLKEADPNHLISISGFDAWDILAWDVGVMKMDFYQPHIYPEIWCQQPEYRSYNQGIQRVEGRLYWLAKNCPTPWLIGEIGFAANDINNTAPHKWYMDGTEAEQASFAEFSTKKTRDCSGSGYAWFSNQDGWDNHSGIQGDNMPSGMGLLKPGLIPTPPPAVLSFEKPAADKFRNYPPVPLPITSNCTIPYYYYDPYATAELNTSNTNRVTGYVYDENHNPVEDAVVFAWSFKSSTFIQQNTQWVEVVDSLYQIYTFTNDTGGYVLEPFNWKYPNNPGKFRIVKIWGSAVSAQSPGFTLGGWSLQQIATNPADFHLNFNSIDQDKIISGQTFPPNTNEQIDAWNSITVSNSTFTGSSANTGLIELKARTVDLNDGTIASSGSEVHIVADVVTPMCNDFSDIIQHKPGSTPLSGSYENLIKTLELQFQPNDNTLTIDIFPNPATDIIKIKSNIKQSFMKVCLIDPVSKAIKEVSGPSEEITIGLKGISKGIYFIKITIDESICIKKIILN